MPELLAMELRAVDAQARTITGVVAPYDATSYLTPDPAGERIVRGAFSTSIRQRETKVPLLIQHDVERAVGMSRSWVEADSGLTATFAVRQSPEGDRALDDAREGYLSALSVGFRPLNQRRASDGVREVAEAMLVEVSLVLIGAYPGADVLAVRTAQDLDALLAPFANPPDVDLSPFVAPWG